MYVFLWALFCFYRSPLANKKALCYQTSKYQFSVTHMSIHQLTIPVYPLDQSSGQWPVVNKPTSDMKTPHLAGGLLLSMKL